ncbi:hypothetical protein [Bacillus sp. ISL-47]|uniref:hypothetical protein n=1 Tax=Bacillus sp. ISL-47 TaxID=2819130 RepID=UPI001BE55616|nr:hypothetical protein [Bacillus sp. ISL-47]
MRDPAGIEQRGVSEVHGKLMAAAKINTLVNQRVYLDHIKEYKPFYRSLKQFLIWELDWNITQLKEVFKKVENSHKKG